MATAQRVTTPSDGSASDFSILSRDNGGAMLPDDIGALGAGALDLSNIHFSMGPLASIAVDGTFEEAVKIIEQLVRENQELKDSVQESNTLMRQQYKYLEDWKDRSSKDHAHMKEKYHQIKAYVLDLKQRVKDRDALNDNLKAQLKQHEEDSSKVEAAILHGQLEEYKTRLSQSEAELHTSEENYAKLSHDLHQLKLQISQNETQKLDINQQLEKAQREKEEMRDVQERLSGAFQKLVLEKQDLVAMNNELMAKTDGGSSDVEYVVVTTDEEMKKTQQSLDGDDAEVEGRKRANNSMSLASLTRHDQAVSDLLIQLQQERNKVSSLTATGNERLAQVQKLERELVERERRLSESSNHMSSQVSRVEAQWREKVDQLILQLEVVNKELHEARDTNMPLAPCEEVQQLRAQVMSLVHELQDTQTQQEAAIRAVSQHRDRCKELEAKATMYQEQLEAQRTKDDQLIETLRMSIISLEKELVKERTLSNSKSHNLTELHKNFDQLCVDYHELLDAYDEYRTHQEARGQQRPGDSITRDVMEKLDNLTAQLITAEETLNQRDEKIEELKRQIQGDEETIGVLNAQAELYRADFEAERSARESINDEKERLKGECDHMRSLNTQLQQEVNSMMGRQLQHMQQRHAAPSHRFSQAPAVGPPAGVMGPPGNTRHLGSELDYAAGVLMGGNDGQMDGGGAAGGGAGGGLAETMDQAPLMQEYICPKCNNPFPDEDSVRLHIEECLRE